MHLFGLLSGHAPTQRAAWGCVAVSWVLCALVLRGTYHMFTAIIDSFAGEVSTEHSSMRRARARGPSVPPVTSHHRGPATPWRHSRREASPHARRRMARVYTIILWNLFGLNMVAQNLRLLPPLRSEVIWIALDFGAKSLFSTLLCQARAPGARPRPPPDAPQPPLRSRPDVARARVPPPLWWPTGGDRATL